MKKRLLSVFVGAALVLGVTTIPAQAASATSLGKLTVQLVDVKGKAIHLKNFQLALTNKGAETDWTTNSKGLADFHSVGASKNYVLTTVTASKYAPVKKSHIVVTAGHTTHVKLTLAVGASISGTVQNTEGQHPTGITVQVLNDKTHVRAASVLTDASGVFRAIGLATGKYTVYYNYSSDLANEFPRLGTLSQGSVSVTQQTSKHGTVSKKHYDATLTTLIRLSGSTTQSGLGSITAYTSDNGFTFAEYDFRPVTTGTSRTFELYLPAGTYKVSADSNATPSAHFWYVSDASATSTDSSAAATITLSDDRSIIVNPHP